MGEPLTAWLIERENRGLEYACGHGWTRDYREALRFLTEADAANFAQRAYHMRGLPSGGEYFDWQDYTRVAEHRWG